LDAGIDDDVFGSVAVVVLLAMGIVQVVEVCSLFASFFAAAALWCQRGCFCYRCVALLFSVAAALCLDAVALAQFFPVLTLFRSCPFPTQVDC